MIDNTIEVDSGVNNIQISPNPVIESTSILFSIKKKERISIDVFDINGNHISNLFNENANISAYSINWNPHQEKSLTINNGFYFVKIRSASFTQTLKLILIN